MIPDEQQYSLTWTLNAVGPQRSDSSDEPGLSEWLDDAFDPSIPGDDTIWHAPPGRHRHYLGEGSDGTTCPDATASSLAAISDLRGVVELPGEPESTGPVSDVTDTATSPVVGDSAPNDSSSNNSGSNDSGALEDHNAGPAGAADTIQALDGPTSAANPDIPDPPPLCPNEYPALDCVGTYANASLSIAPTDITFPDTTQAVRADLRGRHHALRTGDADGGGRPALVRRRPVRDRLHRTESTGPRFSLPHTSYRWADEPARADKGSPSWIGFPPSRAARRMLCRAIGIVRYDFSSSPAIGPAGLADPAQSDGASPHLRRRARWAGTPTTTAPDGHHIPPEENDGPIASFDVSVDPSVPGKYIFEDTSTDPEGDDIDVRWTFGDNYTSIGSPVSHVYKASGVYEVTMTAHTADGQEDTRPRSSTCTCPRGSGR